MIRSEDTSYTNSIFFPPVKAGNRCFYTDTISVPMLKEAYWHGLFPWPDGSGDGNIPWVCPQIRGLILLDDFHIPKTVTRLLKKGTFELRIDTAFEEVITHCAIRNDGSDTWITEKLKKAYCKFHEAGWAHSFEAWNRETGTLAGGLYGVSVGEVFAGESMFFRETGASKFALAHLGKVLQKCGVKLLDTQMVTPVTELFGAAYYHAGDYIRCLEHFRNAPLDTNTLRQAFAALEHLKNAGEEI